MINNPRKNAGQAVLIAVLMFLFIAIIVGVGVTSPVTREARVIRELDLSKASLITTESAEEDVAFRIRRIAEYSSEEVLSLINNAYATTTVSEDILTGELTVLTRGSAGGAIRKKEMVLIRGDNVSFNYGVQAGNGGYELFNTSSVNGNIYSNGTVIGHNGNFVRGSVTSCCSTGLLQDIHATGTVRAHTIENSYIEGNAFYETLIEPVIVEGNKYPDSPDKPLVALPITDEEIDEWEIAAEAGGIINDPCPYIISSDTTIGPVKIDCDLEIRGTQTDVTIAGPVWVKGTLTITNAAVIRIDPDSGKKSEVVIANNPADQETSGKVILRNSAAFEGSGEEGSYVMLVARNRSYEDGGTESAIEFQQTATGDVLLYTNHGEIVIEQSSTLVQVTGYRIEMHNSAELVYEQGLASVVFDSGPGGSWDILTWRETI